MKVPLLDLKAQLENIEADLKKSILEVIDSATYIMGPKVEELENKLAEYCGVKACIGVSSGTDALLIALMALDLKAGDFVITTPYSFFATAGAIVRLGATPIFVDIDQQTYNICPNKLSDWFKQNEKHITKVKAIIPVHIFGQSSNMDPIIDLANQYNIPVIEDAAQAIGATYPSKTGLKKPAASVKWAAFHFSPAKTLEP